MYRLPTITFLVLVTVISVLLASQQIASATSTRSQSTPQPPSGATAVKPEVPITYLNENEPTSSNVGALVFITGLVFEDINGNDIREPDEPSLKGISIGVQIPQQSQTSVPAIAVTDDDGRFYLQVPESAVLTALSPEGWRVVGASSRFATPYMAFGLRPDRVVVQPVFSTPNVIVQSGFNWQTVLMMVGFIAASILLMGWLALRALQRHTRSTAELADWQVRLSRSVPYMARRSIASQVLMPVDHSLARTDTSCEMGLEIAVLDGLPCTSDCTPEANWFHMAEQVIADTLRTSIQIESFLGLSSLPNAWLRFSTRDGQILTFGLSRFRMSGKRWSMGRAINPLLTSRTHTELRMMYQHYAALSDLPGMLPRQCRWYVFVEQAVLILRVRNVA